jgi:hypothetical protein
VLSSGVDLSGRVVTIREKKRDRTKLTTRRVSLTPFLKDVLVFPHSLLSALASKGVGQRIIDDLVGHSTQEQRRRYRHLFPDPVGTGV